jgi:hypothetical protein
VNKLWKKTIARDGDKDRGRRCHMWVQILPARFHIVKLILLPSAILWQSNKFLIELHQNNSTILSSNCTHIFHKFSLNRWYFRRFFVINIIISSEMLKQYLTRKPTASNTCSYAVLLFNYEYSIEWWGFYLLKLAPHYRQSLSILNYTHAIAMKTIDCL